MSTSVQTVSTCELCGERHIRPGAVAQNAPPEWFEFKIVERHEGCDSYSTVSLMACPRCGHKMIEASRRTWASWLVRAKEGTSTS